MSCHTFAIIFWMSFLPSNVLRFWEWFPKQAPHYKQTTRCNYQCWHFLLCVVSAPWHMPALMAYRFGSTCCTPRTRWETGRATVCWIPSSVFGHNLSSCISDCFFPPLSLCFVNLFAIITLTEASCASSRRVKIVSMSWEWSKNKNKLECF